MNPNKNINNEFELQKLLVSIYKRRSPPKMEEYIEKLKQANTLLNQENKQIRPDSSDGQPGGLLYLNKEIPTIVVPDLHARRNFFLSLMAYQPEGEKTVMELMGAGQLQVVCVGDAFHAEKRAVNRWRMALAEYRGFYKKHKNMDEEMKESMGLVEMIIGTKLTFPDYFHFLKGNHENITNENANGNKPFGKFAFEGEMVKTYIIKFYDETFLRIFDKYEKKLPLLAIGRNFLISHAEPRIFHSTSSVRDYNMHHEVVYDFTWTADNAAELNSVNKMLEHYLNNGYNHNGTSEEVYYFGGHRPIPGLYNERAEGKYIQLHNPEKYVIAFIKCGMKIDLERDIIEIPYVKF